MLQPLYSLPKDLVITYQCHTISNIILEDFLNRPFAAFFADVYPLNPT